MSKSKKETAFKDGERQYFTFYRSWRDSLNMLKGESKIRLFDAIMNAGLDRIEPDNLEPIELLVWYQIRPIIFNGWDLAKVRSDASTAVKSLEGEHPKGTGTPPNMTRKNPSKEGNNSKTTAKQQRIG